MKSEKILLAEVILPLHLKENFHWEIPTSWLNPPQVGARVLLALKRKLYVGIVRSIVSLDVQPHKYSPLIAVIDSRPFLSTATLQLWEWVVSYYLSTWGDIYATAIPSFLRDVNEIGIKINTPSLWSPALQEQGKSHHKLKQFLTEDDKKQNWKSLIRALRENEIEIMPSRSEEKTSDAAPLLNFNLPPLSPDQEAVFKKISELSLKPILLHGVTGSGKTFIYLHLIRERLLQGKQVLYLLPEIALSIHFINKIKKYFGEELVYAFHSKMTARKKEMSWLQIKSGKPLIIIGTRSSVFIPSAHIGLIICDEEHDA